MMKNLIKEFFKKKDGVFAVQLFANDSFTLNEFDESHLVLRMPIEKLWMPKPKLFQADPFLFVKDEELYLFYELQYGFDPAKIVMIKTADLKTWTKPIVVLSEPFHLSFPFVFEDEGKIYMIPECEKTDTIRLYEGNDDLTSFRYIRTLLQQKRTKELNYNYSDSHIYKKDGIYYLFTSYTKNWQLYQTLYYSDDLIKGIFVPHPRTPIIIDNEYGRNGGSIIEYGNKLFRISQDCHKDYGENVSLHEVCTLNERQYEEKLYRRNLYTKNNLFPDGGHHLNMVRFNGKYIYSTDYKENHWTWYHLYHYCLVNLHMREKR